MELPWKIAFVASMRYPGIKATSVARIGNGAIAMKLGPTGTSWGTEGAEGAEIWD